MNCLAGESVRFGCFVCDTELIRLRVELKDVLRDCHPLCHTDRCVVAKPANTPFGLWKKKEFVTRNVGNGYAQLKQSLLTMDCVCTESMRLTEYSQYMCGSRSTYEDNLESCALNAKVVFVHVNFHPVKLQFTTNNKSKLKNRLQSLVVYSLNYVLCEFGQT